MSLNEKYIFPIKVIFVILTMIASIILYIGVVPIMSCGLFGRSTTACTSIPWVENYYASTFCIVVWLLGLSYLLSTEALVQRRLLVLLLAPPAYFIFDFILFNAINFSGLGLFAKLLISPTGHIYAILFMSVTHLMAIATFSKVSVSMLYLYIAIVTTSVLIIIFSVFYAVSGEIDSKFLANKWVNIHSLMQYLGVLSVSVLFVLSVAMLIKFCHANISRAS